METTEKTNDWTTFWTTLTVVWMAVLALIFGVFWHSWNLVFGEIPALGEVTWLTAKENSAGVIIKPAVILTLPLTLSRSWDMLMAPIFVLIFCQLFHRAEVRIKEDLAIVSLAISLILGLAFGLAFDLAFSLLFGAALSLVLGLVGGPALGLVSGLGYSFIIGAFWLGLLPGLGVFLIIASPSFLIGAIAAIYRKLTNVDISGLKRLLAGHS